jgi:hypothetical protein
MGVAEALTADEFRQQVSEWLQVPAEPLTHSLHCTALLSTVSHITVLLTHSLTHSPQVSDLLEEGAEGLFGRCDWTATEVSE